MARSDPEVLATAAQAGRILVSCDRAPMPSHFARFMGRQSSMGLIIVSQEMEIGRAVDELQLLWAVTTLEE
jgi:hypothetical protein